MRLLFGFGRQELPACSGTEFWICKLSPPGTKVYVFKRHFATLCGHLEHLAVLSSGTWLQEYKKCCDLTLRSVKMKRTMPCGIVGSGIDLEQLKGLESLL